MNEDCTLFFSFRGTSQEGSEWYLEGKEHSENLIPFLNKTYCGLEEKNEFLY